MLCSLKHCYNERFCTKCVFVQSVCFSLIPPAGAPVVCLEDACLTSEHCGPTITWMRCYLMPFLRRLFKGTHAHTHTPGPSAACMRGHDTDVAIFTSHLFFLVIVNSSTIATMKRETAIRICIAFSHHASEREREREREREIIPIRFNMCGHVQQQQKNNHRVDLDVIM